MRGAEGVEVEGRKVSLTSAEDILVTSEQGQVVLEAGAGLVLDTVTWRYFNILNTDMYYFLSQVMLPHGGVQGYSGEEGQYKLCVCHPSGLVFKVYKNLFIKSL